MKIFSHGSVIVSAGSRTLEVERGDRDVETVDETPAGAERVRQGADHDQGEAGCQDSSEVFVAERDS